MVAVANRAAVNMGTQKNFQKVVLFPFDKYTEVRLLDHRDVCFSFKKIFRLILACVCKQEEGVQRERERRRLSSRLLPVQSLTLGLISRP